MKPHRKINSHDPQIGYNNFLISNTASQWRLPYIPPQICLYLSMIIGGFWFHSTFARYLSAFLFLFGYCSYRIMKFTEEGIRPGRSIFMLRLLKLIRVNHSWAFYMGCVDGDMVFLRDCLVVGFEAFVPKVGSSGLASIFSRVYYLEKRDRQKSLAGAVATVLVGRRLGILSKEIWLKIANYVKEDFTPWEINRMNCAKLLLGVKAGRLSIKQIRDLTKDQLRSLLEDDVELENIYTNERIQRRNKMVDHNRW